jgi:hypothetical protein
MLQHLMFPKPGWVILHIIAVTTLFLLGYSINFQ